MAISPPFLLRLLDHDHGQILLHALGYSDRLELCRLPCVSRALREALSGGAVWCAWQRLYATHWGAIDLGCCVPWKTLYRRRHEETRGQVTAVEGCLSVMRHDWPDFEYIDRDADDDDDEKFRPLTEQEGKLVYYNGYTLTYVAADFPPDGQEVEGMDAAEYPRPSEDSVVAMSAFLSWVRDVESITISDELKAALTRRIQQILRPGEGGGGGGSGGIRMLSYEWLGIGDYGFGLQDNREVYYSPKGYFTVSEMLRILLHRYHLLPVGFFGDHNFYERLASDHPGVFFLWFGS